MFYDEHFRQSWKKLELSIRTTDRLLSQAESRTLKLLMRKSGRDVNRLTSEMRNLRLAYEAYSEMMDHSISQEVENTVASLIYRFKAVCIQLEAGLSNSKASVRQVKTYKRAITQGYFKRMPQRHGHYIDKYK